MKFGKKVVTGIGIMFVLIVLGTVGFNVLEGWDYFQSFYFTLITITTIGYGDIVPITLAGRIFTSFIVITGVGTGLYVLTSLTQAVVEGGFHDLFWRRRMEKSIQKLEDHFIICGYGRTGFHVCEELSLRKQNFVVIEKDLKRVEEAVRDGYLVMQGEASDEEVLRQAGISRAKGIAAVTGSDATNVFVVLTARGMNPSLFILGRFEEQGTEGKLKKAGADRTVSPHMIGGLRMASLLLRPNVTEFIELATASSSIELQMDEVTLKDGSRFAGRTIKESRIKRDHGVMVVGIKKPKGETRVDPDPNTVLHPGDLLIVLGKTDLVLKFKQGEEIESRLPE